MLAARSFGVIAGVAVALSGIVAQSAAAGSLTVSPTTIEVVSPDVAAVARIQNNASAGATAQLRVFRWSQINGVEKLEPVTDVIASPPLAQLGPGAEQIVRIMRTGRAGSSVEESFRLMIDELPPARTAKSGAVAVVVRHAMPVFFRPASTARPILSWHIDRGGGRPTLVVSNSGGRRARIADLVLHDGRGKSVVVAKGLAAYVLAGSTRRIELPSSAMNLSHERLTATAQSDAGSINALVQ